MIDSPVARAHSSNTEHSLDVRSNRGRHVSLNPDFISIVDLRFKECSVTPELRPYGFKVLWIKDFRSAITPKLFLVEGVSTTLPRI